MTFSICVRESYLDDGGDEHTRFGVAVTTRLPGIGAISPFVTDHGAVATQSLVNEELCRKGVAYLADGLAIGDALEALLNADDSRTHRQIHGVDAVGEFAFSGEACDDWFGHHAGENYTVAGNLLAGETVIEAVATTYEESRDDDRPLACRLVDALAAGHAEGGDRREELHVQSAAVRVERTEERVPGPYTDDLRVDATETPIEDLKEAIDLAQTGYEMIIDRYDWE